jgi:hypothetical protein
MQGDFKPPRRSIARQPQACASATVTDVAYPKCGPIFASRRLLPDYNLKAGYLPIRQKCRFHKLFSYNDLWESRELCNVFNERFRMKRADNSLGLPALGCLPSE